MPDATRLMDLREFRDAGYLQEVNRQFFHPLGLALAVTVKGDGAVRLFGIWDGRDDPEGYTFNGFSDQEKANGHRIEDEKYSRRWQRPLACLPSGIEPLE